MESKAFPFFSFTLLIILLPLLSHYTVLAHSQSEKKSPPFEFIQHLKGCHKGENLKGIHELKKYLKKFGYLNYENSKNQTHADDDNFDDLLESAIKTYQLNYNLKSIGVLDDNTVAKMTRPRCGVPDIVNGTTRMRSGKKRQNNHHGSSHLHTVSHYAFFPGSPKWPPSNYHLTYAFLPGTRADAINPASRAFQTWAANTHFTFSQTQDYANANIKISFDSKDHGDGSDFDGRGGVLAHAFAPTDGRFHYDADEQWAVGATPNAFDLETVAIHEIGHLLGLRHSSVEGAIMYPSIPPGTTKGLHRDDIQGIKALYNV